MARRRKGGFYTITFYREECKIHGANISNCVEDCPLAEVAYRVGANVSPFVPGKFNGPPESCYEDEGGEVEIESIVDGEDNEVDIDSFSSSDLDSMEMRLFDVMYDDDEFYSSREEDD